MDTMKTSGGVEITEATFGDLCKSLLSRGKTLAADTQKAALFAATHASTTGNCNLMDELWRVVAPKGQRKAGTTFQRAKAFRAWIVAFTPIILPVEEDKHASLSKGEREWDLEGLAAVNFWEYTKEADPVRFGIDFLAAPYAALQRLEKAREDGKLYNDDGHPMTTEEFTAVRQTLTDMCALVGGADGIKVARETAKEARARVNAPEDAGVQAA